MGSELLFRPISEMVQTVISVINPVFAILIILAVVIGFAFVSIKSTKLNINSKILGIVLIINVVSLPFIGIIPLLTDGIIKPVVESYIACKTYYCLGSCYNHVQNKLNRQSCDEYVPSNNNFFVDADKMYDDNKIREFLKENNNWSILDSKYPLERKYDSVSVLSQYFNRSEQKPNVVLIIVESLGREWSGDTELGVSFTPFVDSLSNYSLYWKNCLSSSARSFGAVPALTGSLPHGPKGFQFGRMPNDNSMISILRSNGYQANAFYASDFAFDCVYEYLLKEKVDYMSTQFKAESFRRKRPEMYTYWGYHDKYMFERSFEELNGMDLQKPQFNLFITISAHDQLNIRGPEQSYFIDKTKNIISKIPHKDKRSVAERNLMREASIYYTDWALRYFFEEYSKRPDFNNTIFIITGDHAAGVESKNRLAFYHVPLIIYSPMLKTSAKFASIVTHNDVAPSIVSLLAINFGLEMPKTVHWMGSELDTSSSFQSKQRFMLMDYSHEISEMLYNDHFYWGEKDAVFSIDEDLNMVQDDNSEIKQDIKDKLDLYKYINSYVYLSNSLTSNPIFEGDLFTKNSTYSIHSMTCAALKEKPSVLDPARFMIVDNENISKGELNRIRISLSADILIKGNLYQDKQMEVVFKCEGVNMHGPKVYKDKIVKFLDQESIQQNKWYKLQVIKDFDVKEVRNIKTSVYIQTPEKDEYWTSDNTLFVKNIEVDIDELRAN